jgi:uncharacterized protein YjbI with pentapeptide repeats
MTKKAGSNRTAGKKTKQSTKHASRPRPARVEPVTIPEPATPLDVRALLLSDVRAFNAWRKSDLAATIDLAGADLRGANLRHAFLAGARMDGCLLDDAALGGAVLSGASLAGASLRRADLRQVLAGPAELMEASLALSPVGSALVRGASLRGACLAAARAQEAVLIEADLTDCDLTDCDLTGAQLKRAQVPETLPDPPPGADDTNGMFARLTGEPLAVREGLGVFAVLVFLAGERGGEANQLLVAIGRGIGLSVPDLQRLTPEGRIVIEAISVTPPMSDWTRRVYFALMCGLASCSAAVAPAELQVLGHFGAMYGLTDRAMARIIGEELGVSLSIGG